METSAATVEQEGAGAGVTAVMAAEAPVDVSVVPEGSVGRTGLAIFMGMKTLEVQCSLRYSPPFSSQSFLLIHPSVAPPTPPGGCSKAQSLAPYQESRAGRDAIVTWERVSQSSSVITRRLLLDYLNQSEKYLGINLLYVLNFNSFVIYLLFILLFVFLSHSLYMDMIQNSVVCIMISGFLQGLVP